VAQTFDEAELLERVDNDVEFLAETVEMLDTDGVALVEAIDVSVASGDAPGVARNAHALKGMISNFCAPDAQSSALELETIGKSGDLSAAAGALGTLKVRLQALTTELHAFVQARA